MSLLILSLISVFYFGAQDKPPVSFTGEYIEFRLQKTTLTVNGIYFFVNHTANIVSKEISYPFPVSLTKVDSLRVFDNLQGRFLDVKKTSQQVSFRITIPPYDTVRLNIYYRQKGIRDTVRYILTTIQNWGEPLKKAEYTFETGKAIKIQSFSFAPDNSSILSNQQKYFWSRKNFMPEKDFIVVFRKK